MDLFYWHSPKGNFGDDLNLWLWDELLPGWRGWDPQVTLVGVGTLLNGRNFPAGRPGRFLVAGSGVGYGDGLPPVLGHAGRFDIRALRGPRSARALGLPESLGILDPAVMIAGLPGFRAPVRGGRPVFVPHLSSVDSHPWETVCKAAGVDYVSPCGEARAVIARLAAAPLVIAESMHAAILADALRTPWRAVSLSPAFNGTKWLDWADTLDLVPDIRPLVPAVERLRRLGRMLRRPAVPAAVPAAVPVAPTAASGRRQLRRMIEQALLPGALAAQLRLPAQLSSDAALARQTARYAEVLEGIRRDYG
jgi:succinoglycan biosynthesis protein ExoV